MSCLLANWLKLRCRYKLHKMAYRCVGCASVVCSNLVGVVVAANALALWWWVYTVLVCGPPSFCVSLTYPIM